MTDENPKPPPKDEKRYETEWAFSFDTFGESIAQLMHQFGIGNDADLQTTTLTEALGGAVRGQVRLDLTVGQAALKALPADSSNLVEVDVTSIGSVEMLATTEGDTKSVRLRQKRSSSEDLFKPVKDVVDTVAHNQELAWDVRLSPRVPIMLDISAGLTTDTFDLTGLNIPRLKLDSGTGTTTVKLPGSVSNVHIDGGLGNLELMVPDEAKMTLHMDIGVGATTLTIGQANVKAEIEGGVGSCTVIVPAGAAVRIQAESGLGNIDVPERLQPVSFESEFISESGVWQTEGYEHAVSKIDLNYEGGVGSLVIQEAPA